jgi:epoxyqueuosine reductase QueG
MNEQIEKLLLGAGASVVGFADVTEILGGEISHLEKAISIGIDRKLNEHTVHILCGLQKQTSGYLKAQGFKYLRIPPDSDRANGTFISRLYPLFTHKIAATCSGIGWIGKNGLLISPVYGPRLSLATILTDAPLRTDRPIESGRCGDCSLCVDSCPPKALTGNTWMRCNPFIELVHLEVCISHKKKSRPVNGKPNCGLCINICPYGRARYNKM